jgi:hypothetical protein
MTVYRLTPAGTLDITDARVTAHAGALVRKVQPRGCPRNGTFRMCYVERADTGAFIGLVNEASLARVSARERS